MQNSEGLEDENLQGQMGMDSSRSVSQQSSDVSLSSRQEKRERQQVKVPSARWYICGIMIAVVIAFQVYIILLLQKDVETKPTLIQNSTLPIVNTHSSPKVSKSNLHMVQKVVIQPRNIPARAPAPQWKPPKHIDLLPPLKLLNLSFSLWDLNKQQKLNLLKKGREISAKKKKNTKFMDINYDKDDETAEFFSKYEAESYVYDWSSVKITGEQRTAMNEDFQKALEERRRKYRPIIQRYADLYKGRNNLLHVEKGIYHSQFVEALANLALTGENIAASPILSALYERQKKYFNQRYNLSDIKTEIPFCVITPTYNNVPKRHYMWNTEAILQQEYSNFKWIIVDDASTDETLYKTASFLKWRNSPKDKVILVASRKHRTALENIYYAAHKYCDYGQIMVVVDGDDEIIGTQIFKLYNAIYQQQKPYILYSNFFSYNQKQKNDPVAIGLSRDYPDVVRSQSSYRYYYHAYSHLRSSISDLFLMLKASSLKDSKGEMYWTLCDNAIFFPSMELACGKVQYIPEMLYWYFTNTGTNDYQTPRQKEYGQVFRHIADSQKHYECVDNKLVEAKKALAVEATNQTSKNHP